MKKAVNRTPFEFIDVESHRSTEWGDMQLEHIYKYLSVQTIVQDKVVLDIDCGNGCGSILLAKNAKLVVGIDTAQEKVDYASTSCGATNIQFLQGDATHLEFGDGSFDVVVSFQTLEYWAAQEQMLSELSRVLRPDGILIISSPNKFTYSKMDEGFKRFDLQVFTELLWQKFKSIRHYGQRIQFESIINPITEDSNEFLAWAEIGQKTGKVTTPSKESVCFFAICAKSVNVLMPNLEASILNFDGFEIANQLANLRITENDHNQLIQNLRSSLAKSSEEIIDLRDALEKSNQELINLRGGLEKSSPESVGLSNIKTSLLKLQKILLDSQSYIVRSDSSIQTINYNVERMSKNFLVRVKRKIRSIFFRRAPTESFKPKYSLSQCPWLILFDAEWYLENNSDVLKSGMAPLEHYWEFGIKEGRNPNAFFNSSWYLSENEDVRVLGLNPLEHYWQYGGKEGRNPSLSFDSLRYYKLNPDVKEADINPLEHYLIYGRKEGRGFDRIRDESVNSYKSFTAKIAQYLAPYKKYYRSIQEDAKYLKSAISGLTFSEEEFPLISIIIPVYGKWEYTLQCLRSIHQNLPTQYSLEIIVIDDCSPDNSGEIVSQIQGIRYERNSTNLGFVKSCNYGASIANGKYLYFLNNDTVIMPGNIEQLLNTFKKFSLTGLVGSKLIYPNGALQ